MEAERGRFKLKYSFMVYFKKNFKPLFQLGGKLPAILSLSATQGWVGGKCGGKGCVWAVVQIEYDSAQYLLSQPFRSLPELI